MEKPIFLNGGFLSPVHCHDVTIAMFFLEGIISLVPKIKGLGWVVHVFLSSSVSMWHMLQKKQLISCVPLCNIVYLSPHDLINKSINLLV